MPPQNSFAPEPTQPTAPVPPTMPVPPVPPVQPAVPQPPAPDVIQPSAGFGQPPVAPAPPAQPFAAPQPGYVAPPAPMQPMSASSLSAAGNSKKNLLLSVFGGIGGVIVLIVLAIFVLPMLSGVSKADYEKAFDLAKTARDNYSDMAYTYISTSSTDTERQNDLDTIRKAESSFDSNIKKLGDTKAVKRDKDVGKDYKALMTKKVKFDAAMAATIESYDKILPAINQLDNLDSNNPVAGIERARTSFQAISGLESQTNQQFVTDMINKLGTYEALAKKIVAYRADYTKYDSNVANQYYDTATGLSTLMRNWSSDLDKQLEDSSISSEFNALGELLAKKVNQS